MRAFLIARGDIMEIVAQIIGILALSHAVTSFQLKTHKMILLFQLIATALFVVHYALLEAHTGAILNAVAMIRSVVFINKDKAWAKNIAWLIFFCAVSIGTGVLTWDGSIISILPVFGMLFTTVAFWIKNPKYVRMTAFPSSPLWLVYNIRCQAFGGAITEVINMISIIVAMIRLDFIKKKQ